MTDDLETPTTLVSTPDRTPRAILALVICILVFTVIIALKLAVMSWTINRIDHNVFMMQIDQVIKDTTWKTWTGWPVPGDTIHTPAQVDSLCRAIEANIKDLRRIKGQH